MPWVQTPVLGEKKKSSAGRFEKDCLSQTSNKSLENNSIFLGLLLEWMWHPNSIPWSDKGNMMGQIDGHVFGWDNKSQNKNPQVLLTPTDYHF
jgi:hypothetical protein